MGYRSDVLFRAETNDDEFKEIFLKLTMTEPKWLQELLALSVAAGFEDFHFDKTGLLIYLEGWKWNDSYKDVVIVQEAITYFEDETEVMENLNTCFCRMGDETDDIEENYFNAGWDLGSVTRSIIY